MLCSSRNGTVCWLFSLQILHNVSTMQVLVHWEWSVGSSFNRKSSSNCPYQFKSVVSWGGGALVEELVKNICKSRGLKFEYWLHHIFLLEGFYFTIFLRDFSFLPPQGVEGLLFFRLWRVKVVQYMKLFSYCYEIIWMTSFALIDSYALYIYPFESGFIQILYHVWIIWRKKHVKLLKKKEKYKKI